MSTHILACLLVALVACAERAPPARDHAPPWRTTSRDAVPPADAVDYQALQADVSAERQRLASRYRTARTAKARAEVLALARDRFVRAVADQLAPPWYGTAWAFHGTSQVPGEGAIACGYLVSTLLRDAGLAVERIRMAQQPAERIILSLTGEAHAQRFSNRPLARFVEAVADMGEGLFVVGLDTHVGFLVVRGREVRFLHSDYGGRGVVSEDARTSAALRSSAYRVVGRISADDTLLVRWLDGAPVPTRRR